MVTKVQSIKAGSWKKEHFRGYGNEAKPDSAPQEFKLSLHLLLAPICAPQGLCLPSGLLRGEPFSLGQYSDTRRFPHVDMDRNGAFTKFLSFFSFLRHPQHIKKRCVSLNATNLVSYSTPYRWKRITTVVCSHCLSSQGQSWPQHDEFH